MGQRQQGGGGQGSLCQLGKAHTWSKHTLQLADDIPSACTPTPPGPICCQLNHLAQWDSASPHRQRTLKPRSSSWQAEVFTNRSPVAW